MFYDGFILSRIAAITATSGTLTGILADGSPISSDFYISDNASIVLTPIPSAVILVTIGISFTGWLLKRRKTI